MLSRRRLGHTDARASALWTPWVHRSWQAERRLPKICLPELVNMTLFGSRVLADVIKSKGSGYGIGFSRP